MLSTMSVNPVKNSGNIKARRDKTTDMNRKLSTLQCKDIDEKESDCSDSPGHLITLNLRGKIFEINPDCFRGSPECRLAGLTETDPNYNADRKQYFFNRDPQIFNCILNFFVAGSLHYPSCVCVDLVKSELAFWRLDPDVVLSSCCWTRFEANEENRQTLQSIHTDGKTDKAHGKNSCRLRAWLFLDEPNSSTGAYIWSLFMIFTIVVSIICLTLESLPACRVFPDWLQTLMETNGTTLGLMLVYSSPHASITFIEVTANAILTLEIVLRFALCPTKCAFAKNIMNYLDVIGVFPVWMILGMYYAATPALWADSTFFRAFQVWAALRLLRVFAFLRLFRNNMTLRIILLAWKASFKELAVLALLLLMFSSIFATVIYYVELSHGTFANIPIGMWWAVITMTTVGYGDYYPVTPFGYFIGAICGVFGILVVAMPIPIVVNNFSAYYNCAKDSQRLEERERKAKDKAMYSAKPIAS